MKKLGIVLMGLMVTMVGMFSSTDLNKAHANFDDSAYVNYYSTAYNTIQSAQAEGYNGKLAIGQFFQLGPDEPFGTAVPKRNIRWAGDIYPRDPRENSAYKTYSNNSGGVNFVFANVKITGDQTPSGGVYVYLYQQIVDSQGITTWKRVAHTSLKIDSQYHSIVFYYGYDGALEPDTYMLAFDDATNSSTFWTEFNATPYPVLIDSDQWYQ